MVIGERTSGCGIPHLIFPPSRPGVDSWRKKKHRQFTRSILNAFFARDKENGSALKLQPLQDNRQSHEVTCQAPLNWSQESFKKLQVETKETNAPVTSTSLSLGGQNYGKSRSYTQPTRGHKWDYRMLLGRRAMEWPRCWIDPEGLWPSWWLKNTRTFKLEFYKKEASKKARLKNLMRWSSSFLWKKGRRTGLSKTAPETQNALLIDDWAAESAHFIGRQRPRHIIKTHQTPPCLNRSISGTGQRGTLLLRFGTFLISTFARDRSIAFLKRENKKRGAVSQRQKNRGFLAQNLHWV